MRIVCNANVLIPGILFGGKPGDVLRHCSSGKITNFTTQPLLREIEDVLQRPKFGLSEEQFTESSGCSGRLFLSPSLPLTLSGKRKERLPQVPHLL